MLGGHVTYRIADLVNNTQLNLGIREYRIDCIRESGQAVYRGDQNVFYTPIIETSQYRQPEACVLTFR